jgi:hypothetical protein
MKKKTENKESVKNAENNQAISQESNPQVSPLTSDETEPTHGPTVDPETEPVYSQRVEEVSAAIKEWIDQYYSIDTKGIACLATVVITITDKESNSNKTLGFSNADNISIPMFLTFSKIQIETIEKNTVKAISEAIGRDEK